MVSGDQNGTLNLWTLGATKGDGLVHKTTMGHSDQDGPVTALSIWNRISKGIVIAAYGTGQLRIFAIPSGSIVAEVAAHANWITGMDLAAVSGLLVTISEDGFMRVWQLSTTGRIIEHRFSRGVKSSLLTGVKFLAPKGASFAL